MTFRGTILSAARFACVSGAVAASFALPSIADQDERSSHTAASRASAAPALQQLTLSGLEHRLRETRAISVFQKLALQNDVNDMLARIRHAHLGGKPALAALRAPYDRLMANIQIMLERDPQLAREIATSREAIWDLLSDRSKRASL
jgi:hypothetical protein